MPTQFNYFSIIPMPVITAAMPGDAKLLYGLIVASLNEVGECEATNTDFAFVFKVSDRNIRRWLNQLEECKFIDVTFKGNKRTISPIIKADKNVLLGQNCPTNGRTKLSCSDKNVHDKNVHVDKNVRLNSNENQGINENKEPETLQTTTTDYIKTNNISRSSRTKKENSAPPQFLFSETKYVTDTTGVELFENDILAKSKDYDVADLKYYYNRALSWSNEKQARKYDWITTVITWMQIDNQKGKLILKSKTQFNNDTGITDASGYKLTRNRAKAIQRLIEEGELDR